jgi:glycosyltransferase involved in cell wall biosynthesis
VSERTIVQVTLWNSPYLGNVMTSQLSLAAVTRARLGLGTHFVLAHGAADQPWLADLEAAGTTWSVLSPERRAWRAHLHQVVRESPTALVHTHFTAADLQSAAAAAAVGAPCIWHIGTGFTGYSPRQRVKDLVKMRIVARRHVARIVAVSPWLGELARRRGAPADRIEVLPNAIVVDRFAHLPERAAARERFGLDPDADVVLGLGWWPEVKGVDVLLDALEAVAARHPRMQALLVGEEWMEAFLAERSPQPPAWLRTSRFVSDSAWLFAAADVFVSASRHEGQSSAIGEALACGLPVVMSDIPGTAGWGGAPQLATFESGNVGELASRIDRFLSDEPALRVAAGEQNPRWVRGHAGIDAWCARLCDVYASLI